MSACLHPDGSLSLCSSSDCRPISWAAPDKQADERWPPPIYRPTFDSTGGTWQVQGPRCSSQSACWQISFETITRRKIDPGTYTIAHGAQNMEPTPADASASSCDPPPWNRRMLAVAVFHPLEVRCIISQRWPSTGWMCCSTRSCHRLVTVGSWGRTEQPTIDPWPFLCRCRPADAITGRVALQPPLCCPLGPFPDQPEADPWKLANRRRMRRRDGGPGDTCLPAGSRPHQQIDVAVMRLQHLID
jgi:hypothetical protein